ncbi:MAG: hypothetical protein AAF633_24525, partial [Chloroflexota bacterium]
MAFIAISFFASISPAVGQVCSQAVVVTTLNDSGAGSLRQALLDICPDGTISFDVSLADGTIDLISSLSISQPVTIEASLPLTVSGQSVLRVMVLNASAANQTVTVRGFTIANSTSLNGSGINNSGFDLFLDDMNFVNNSAAEAGGAVFVQDTITGTASLSVTNSIFNSNLASNGGGIFADTLGSVVVENGLFVDNEATSSGGGYSGSSAEFIDTRFVDNTGVSGGGLHVQDGSLVSVSNAQFDSNQATRGGAVLVDDGLLEIVSTAIAFNAAENGGGIFVNAGGILSVESTTIYSNTATAGNGGGILVGFEAEALMANLTLSDNGADADGGNLYNDGSLSIANSILANSA